VAARRNKRDLPTSGRVPGRPCLPVTAACSLARGAGGNARSLVPRSCRPRRDRGRSLPERQGGWPGDGRRPRRLSPCRDGRISAARLPAHSTAASGDRVVSLRASRASLSAEAEARWLSCVNRATVSASSMLRYSRSPQMAPIAVRVEAATWWAESAWPSGPASAAASRRRSRASLCRVYWSARSRSRSHRVRRCGHVEEQVRSGRFGRGRNRSADSGVLRRRHGRW